MAIEHFFGLKKDLLPLVDGGSKDLEIRVADPQKLIVAVGEFITFNNKCRRRVKAIRRYASFRAMLQVETPGRIMPGWSQGDVLRGLQGIYPPERESLGVLVFELEVGT